jgi:hypothetical protein
MCLTRRDDFRLPGCNVLYCGESTDVSEEVIAYIFSVEELNSSHARNQAVAANIEILLVLLAVLHPEDGSDIFLRNVGFHSVGHKMLYPRLYNSSLLFSREPCICPYP